MMSENQESNSQLNETNTAVRQNLVDTAVNFLLNADVLSKSEEHKAAFLRNKGLTDAEILLAFDKAKSDPRNNAIAHQNLAVASPIPYPHQTYSLWPRLGRISSSFIFLAVALYGVHHFYKLYIEPLLFGKKPGKGQLGQMEEQLSEINNSILQLSSTVSTLEKSVNSHAQEIDKLIEANGFVTASVAVSSLKTEIGAVKSLLINRHQFPAVPKVVIPSIPHWQLHSPENEDSETQPTIEDGQDNPENETSTKPKLIDSPSSYPASADASENKNLENGIGEALDTEAAEQNGETREDDVEKV